MMNIKKISNRTWASWCMLILFYSYQYILRVIPNILLPLMGDVDGVIFGQFSGVYYTGYALAHMPLGILVNRYGLKKIFPWAVIISAIGIYPIIYAETWTARLIGRALTGVGSSFAPIAAFYLLSQILPPKKFTKLFSIMLSIGLIAAIYAGAPLAYMMEQFDKNNVLLFLMIFGIAFGCISILVLQKESPNHEINISAVWQVIAHPKVLLIGLSCGLMIGTLEGFPDAWGALFLTKKYGLSTVDAAQVTSFIFLGMFVGCPLCSWIAARKENYYLKTLAAVGALNSILFFFVLSFGDISYIALGIIFAIMGVCCGYQVPALYAGSKVVSPKVASLASTVVNMIMMSFGHIIHSIIGFSVEHLGGVESLRALNDSLFVIPITGFFGFFIFAKLSRTVKIS